MRNTIYLFYEERLRGLDLFNLTRRRLGEELLKKYKYLKRRCKEDGASRAHWLQEVMGKHWSIRRSPPEHQQILSYCEADKVLAQVVQRGCIISFLGDPQKMHECGSEQPDVVCHGWVGWGKESRGGAGQMTSRGPFHPKVFCDSVILSILAFWKMSEVSSKVYW